MYFYNSLAVTTLW